MTTLSKKKTTISSITAAAKKYERAAAVDEIAAFSYTSLMVLISVLLAFGVGTSAKRFADTKNILTAEAISVENLIVNSSLLKKIIDNIYPAIKAQTDAVFDEYTASIVAYAKSVISTEFGQKFEKRSPQSSGDDGFFVFFDYRSDATTAALAKVRENFEKVAAYVSNNTSSTIESVFTSSVRLINEVSVNRENRLVSIGYTFPKFFWVAVIGMSVVASLFPFLLLNKNSEKILIEKGVVSVIFLFLLGLVIYMMYEFDSPFGGFIQINKLEIGWGSFLTKY